MKYDEERRYYYLTTNEAQELSGYQNLEGAGINSNRLKKHGKTLMRWLLSNRYDEEYPKGRKPSDFVRYRIYKNKNNEQNHIEDMLLELIEWDYDVDGSRKVYEDGAGYKDLLPPTVKEIGYRTGLKFEGKVNFKIPDDEFEVGY